MFEGVLFFKKLLGGSALGTVCLAGLFLPGVALYLFFRISSRVSGDTKVWGLKVGLGIGVTLLALMPAFSRLYRFDLAIS